jgi:hypothetical protein
VMVGSFILLIRDQMTYLDVDPEKWEDDDHMMWFIKIVLD